MKNKNQEQKKLKSNLVKGNIVTVELRIFLSRGTVSNGGGLEAKVLCKATCNLATYYLYFITSDFGIRLWKFLPMGELGQLEVDFQK